jgi:hypothetical protein
VVAADADGLPVAPGHTYVMSQMTNCKEAQILLAIDQAKHNLQNTSPFNYVSHE